MKICLVGSGEELETLSERVKAALSANGLDWFANVATTNDEAYRLELGITQNPALCVEEESIDFRDMIFEGAIPSEAELASLFRSIFGSHEGDSCGDGWCGDCSGGCSV